MEEITRRDWITVYGTAAVLLWYVIYNAIELLIEMYLEYGLLLTAITFADSLLFAAYTDKWFYGFRKKGENPYSIIRFIFSSGRPHRPVLLPAA